MEKTRHEVVGKVVSAKNDKTITILVETYKKDPKYGKLYHIVYDDPKAKEKIQIVHKMEEKHYNKFWYMLKKYHKNWWT